MARDGLHKERGPQKERAPQQARGRPFLVITGVTLAAILCAWALLNAFGEIGFEREPPEPIRIGEKTTEPPPDLGPTPTMDERRAFWIRMLITSDEEYAEWARAMLIEDGDESLDALRALAERSIDSNPALIQHVLVVMLARPRADDVGLARAVLNGRDDHSIARACTLLAAIGPPAEAAVPRLAELAVDRSYPIPGSAMQALRNIGTPSAVDAIIDAAPRMEVHYRGFAYVALGDIGGPVAIDFLNKQFEVVEERMERIGIAEGLLHAGVQSPVAWIEAEMEATAVGGAYYESALTVLAKAGNVTALRVLAARARAHLDSDERRARAVNALSTFPLHNTESLLRELTQPGTPRYTRKNAWRILVEKGADGALERLLQLLESTGRAGREDREVASLALGELRLPEAGPPLIEALGAVDPAADEERAFLLRALVLCGNPETADIIVRAMVSDDAPVGESVIAFNTYNWIGHTRGEFARALGAAALRALQGEFGEPTGAGLQHLILTVGTTRPPDAAQVLERYLKHDDMDIRDAALQALPFTARPESMDALRAAWKLPLDPLQRQDLLRVMEMVHYVR